MNNNKKVLGQHAPESIADYSRLAFSRLIQAEIQSLINRASSEARSREEQASREQQSAYQEGYERGLADGAEKEREDHLRSIDALLIEAKKKSNNAIRNLEVKVIELAVTIAEQLTRKSIAVDPAVVESMVAETMSHIIGSEKVVLKVSADDYKTINSRYNTWLGLAGGAAEFKIEIDKRLRTGDFIVESDGGIIDSVINDRIDVLVEELLKVSQ